MLRRPLFVIIVIFAQDLIAIEYESLVRSNHEASKARCWELLTHLDQAMKQKLQEGHYSCPGGYSVYTTDLQDIQKQYTATQGLGVKVISYTTSYYYCSYNTQPHRFWVLR